MQKIFSETQVPSIHQVVPALLKLQDRLLASVGNPSLPPLLRVAAQSALDVFDKYMRLFKSSSIYWVALGELNAVELHLVLAFIDSITLVMCPYYKLQWFKERGYEEEDVDAVKKLVHSMFEWMSGIQKSPQESQYPESPEMDTKVSLILVLFSFSALHG
jgi:hypothetical protein